MDCVVEINGTGNFIDNFTRIKELMEADNSKNPGGIKWKVKYDGVTFEDFGELQTRINSELQSKDKSLSETLPKSKDLMERMDRQDEKRKHR